MSNIKIVFENPWMLLVAIPALAFLVVPFILLPKRARMTVKKITSLALHLTVTTLLVLILSGVTIVKTTDEQAVLLLVDFSDSTKTVQAEIQAHAEELLRLIDKKTPTGVVVFGDEQLYSVKLKKDKRQFKADKISADATNIDAALEYASTLFPKDSAGRIILLTDGKETCGDASKTAHYLATKGIRLDAVYFDTTNHSTQEIQISSFVAPEGAFVNEEASFEVEIQSNVAKNVRVELYEDESLVLTQEVEVGVGSTHAILKTTVKDAGIHTYRAKLLLAVDTLIQNNESYAFVKVAEKKSALVITDSLTNAWPLEKLLGEGKEVKITTADHAPTTIVDLCNYDEVILSNANYSRFPKGYDKILETYVKDYGRSLFAVGGSETFMYGNMEGTALEEMLPVDFSFTESSEGRSVALMLVLDCSSSMSNRAAYLSVAKQGAIKCVEAMSDRDYAGVVSFNTKAYLNSKLIPTTPANKERLNLVISSLSTWSGTYYTEALKMAHQQLLQSDADVKHIIFLSDGQPSDYDYPEAAAAIAADGISLSTIGLGYSSNLLEAVAESAGGRYYHVRRATDLPDIMLSETEQVAAGSLVMKDIVPVIAKESELTDKLGTTKLPKLKGYLGTTLKEEATAYITTEEGHPIYASWDYGRGKVACFTSDLNGHWSSEWLASSVGQELTNSMVEINAGKVHRDSSLSLDILAQGKMTDIVVSTAGTNKDNVVSAKVNFGDESQTYLLTQTKPGQYEGSIPTKESGVYKLTITESGPEKKVVDTLETAIASSYLAEYDAFNSEGEALLVNLCSYSDGNIFKDMKMLAEVKMAENRLVYKPMAWFAVLAMILFIADIAVRKIRWKDLKRG